MRFAGEPEKDYSIHYKDDPRSGFSKLLKHLQQKNERRRKDGR